MAEQSVPKFSGPNAGLFSRMWAKSEIRKKIHQNLNQASEMVAQGTLQVDEASDLFGVKATDAYRNQILRHYDSETSVEMLISIGFNPKLARILIDEFGNLENLAKTNIDELHSRIGIDRRKSARIIKEIRKIV